MTDHDAMRLKAAAEAGLPAGLAPRLQGDTADELAVDAQALAASMPRQPEDHNDLIRRPARRGPRQEQPARRTPVPNPRRRLMTATTTSRLPDNEFFACPECGGSDGYINIGKGHWFYCQRHRTKAMVGANLFSGWKDETEDEQRERYDELGFRFFRDVGTPPRRGLAA